MPPYLALFLWLIFVLGLLRFDPAREHSPSMALWVPLIWMFIVGSRLPSQWLGVDMDVSASQAFEEGNALDRTILAFLILIAFGILVSRIFNWGGFFARNFALLIFLLFALMSFMWSDFPLVALKRWFRDLGGYLVILVVLTDPRPLEAIRTLLRRLCFLLIPLSILVIKYFPGTGRMYEFWSGTPMYVGATTSKNMLGVACLVSGIYFFWDTVTRWPDRKDLRTKRAIYVNVLLILMTFWLLSLANSATSKICLAMGCLVIAAAHTKLFRRYPGFLKVMIPVTVCVYMVLEFGFGISGQMAEMVGRNATLTGRTDLWKLLLTMHTNPIVGTGYESFWLGPRLEWIWRNFTYVNEAHNGYLEIYLDLGFIGLFLLMIMLIAYYRGICRGLSSRSPLATLSLALWTVLIFYNMTEAAFKGSQLIWLTFLLAAIVVPERALNQATDAVPLDGVGNRDRFRHLPFEPTTFGR